jgi:phosphoglycolate phosphatase-like HAD superfamily hydrolase
MTGRKLKQPKAKANSTKKITPTRKPALKSRKLIKTELVAIVDQLRGVISLGSTFPSAISAAGHSIKKIYFDIGNTLLVRRENGEFVWAAQALETVTYFASLGIPLGIISNNPGLTRSQLKALLPNGFFDWFVDSCIILSSEFGSDKSDLRIFYHALQQARVQSCQCLFVGEDAGETLNAQRAGMISLRIAKFESDFAFLRSVVAPV